MPARLFLFVQCELPWALTAPDGRYLLRSHTDGQPERVVVLSTLGARRALLARGPGRLTRRAPLHRRAVSAEPEPEPVVTTRATIIDPVSVSAERQARAWLAGFDSERELAAAFAALNRLLHARRIATADPYTREVSPAQALTIRAGWGEGEQVAAGLWLHAVELPEAGSLRARVRRRASALRPDERLAELLGAREEPLLCEELALRARLDLDQGRLAHAAIELDRALAGSADRAGRRAPLGPAAARVRAAIPARRRGRRRTRGAGPRRARRGDDPPCARAPGGHAASALGGGVRPLLTTRDACQPAPVLRNLPARRRFEHTLDVS